MSHEDWVAKALSVVVFTAAIMAGRDIGSIIFELLLI